MGEGYIKNLNFFLSNNGGGAIQVKLQFHILLNLKYYHY